MLKINIFFQIKYTKAILSKNTRKLLWFEITKMLIVVSKNKSLVSFITICGTLSFPIRDVICGVIVVSVCSDTELQTTRNCVIVAPVCRFCVMLTMKLFNFWLLALSESLLVF